MMAQPELDTLSELMHVTCNSLNRSPHAIVPLATDLCGSKLINGATLQSIKTTTGISSYEKASEMVTAVQGNVALNGDKFYLFAKKLEDHGLVDLSKKLLETCGM